MCDKETETVLKALVSREVTIGNCITWMNQLIWMPTWAIMPEQNPHSYQATS